MGSSDTYVLPRLAEPDTPLGIMQRGRGASFLWAKTNHADVREVLLECLTNDPRQDRQVEQRAHLYLEIAEEIELDAAPLVTFVERASPWERGWSLEAESAFVVLGRLAACGESTARSVLHTHLESGPLWNQALAQLESYEELWAGTDDLLSIRLTDQGVSEVLQDELYRTRIEEEPWRSWRARQPALEAIARKALADERRSDPKQPTSAMSTAELLQWPESRRAARVLATRQSDEDVRALRDAAKGEELPAKGIALEALGLQNDPTVLDVAIEVLQRNHPGALRGAAHRYIEALAPSLTLARAREWFVGEPSLRTAGAIVLEEHAQREDVPRLLSELVPALRSGEMYRLCDILNALLRFADDGPFPDAEVAFVEAPYSRARTQAARLLRAANEDFGERFAYECLWDCEEETREIGASVVDQGLPGAAQRVEYIKEARERE